MLVVAGAGSGKTRVITAKIAHLVDNCGIAARHVAAVTFTNKAAREMKARVSRLLTADAGRGLRISTFHTLGLNILRRELATAGLRAGFSILDEQDVDQLLRELGSDADQTAEGLKAARWQISAWKNALLDPHAAASQAADGQDSLAAALYAAYQQALRAYNAVDFDDLILRPVTLLRNDPDLRERWQNQIRYLLVDEYQDTNNAQYEMVRLLVGVRGALTVVGDDDQSIYAWRGARPENLARLRLDYPRLEVIKLEQNYRSTGRILHAANCLIAHNEHVFDKRLWSQLGPGDPLRVISCRDAEDEAERVVSEIIQQRFHSSAAYADFAILYRGNHQARPFEKALRTQNLPYYISGGTSFFAHTEIKDLMAYLRLVVNPDDDSAFLRIINTPRREIGAQTLESLAVYAGQRGCSLLRAIGEFGLETRIKPKALGRLRDFAGWLQAMAQLERHLSPGDLARRIVADLGYIDWLRQSSHSEKAMQRRWANIEELLVWLDKLLADTDREGDLGAMLNHLSLLDILDRQDDADTGDRIVLMTLHGAKGLEWPRVFLVGMEEELLPHRSSIEEDNIAEERRLAYVGITRAQRQLVMTYAERRRRGGELQRCEPSRFIGELPEDDLHWEGRGVSLSKEEKQARGKASLAGLKALLGN